MLEDGGLACRVDAEDQHVEFSATEEQLDAGYDPEMEQHISYIETLVLSRGGGAMILTLSLLKRSTVRRMANTHTHIPCGTQRRRSPCARGAKQWESL